MVRRVVALLLALLPAGVSGQGLPHFEVTATFVPAKKAEANAAVAVSFHALEPDLRVNTAPAPRLTLDLAQTVLVGRGITAKARVPQDDPLTTEYQDLAKPLLFPVAIAATAPRGTHLVKANVVFFYCSPEKAWCRRGVAEVEIPVTVR